MGRNSQARRFNGVLRAVAWVCILAVLPSSTVRAQVQAVPPASAGAIAVEREATPVTLLVGRSAVVNVDRPIVRVSLTSAEVADALVTSSNQLLVHGKAPGTISMFVWERAGEMRRFEVTVLRDMVELDRQLVQLFPGEAIQARLSGRQIVLSGTVSRKDLVDRVTDVAAGFVAKRDEVISLLQVQEGQRTNQVLLKVRFAEVSRSALTELGLSIFTSPLGVNNTLGRITTQQFSSPGFEDFTWKKESGNFGAPVTEAEGKFTFSDFLNFFVLSERYDLGLLVRALSSRGLFQSLAEPNLVAESGKEASFLAGGEFPIPIAQGSGANIGVSVQFKEFGVRLAFLPTVTGNRVHLKVRPEVSMLDFNNAVFLGGFRIPALTTRRTETELELRDGQTFAIAGLMNNSMNTTLQKIPGIGDIPILGYLFRSKAAKKDQTELVVIITPQILPADSPGVTSTLPRLDEPFLPRPQQDETLPPPPPAFPPERSPGDAAVPPSTPVPMVVPKPAPVATPRTLTSDERKAAEQSRRDERAKAERAQKEARARAEAEQRASAAEAKARARQAGEDRRKAMADAELRQAEEKRQGKLAREAAQREAGAARRAAEEARRQAEGAKRQAEAERERQAAIEAAAAKLKAAQDEYRAQVARQQGTR
ncbi:MAG TPA: pilus assembly protein N-terminal domain-containing protein [Vicinamibacterales bacterium]